MSRRAPRACRYTPRFDASELSKAIAYVLEGTEIMSVCRREYAALQRHRWAIAEIDQIRLAGISRRLTLARLDTADESDTIVIPAGGCRADRRSINTRQGETHVRDSVRKQGVRGACKGGCAVRQSAL